MAQSLVQIYVHIIFSTKNRLPLIMPDYETDLYQYLTNQCNLSGCPALEVGGHVDHVHILCRLSKHSTIPKLLEKVKGSSSKWMKTKHPLLSEFYWQDGYGAFSVSPNEIDKVISYIKHQHEHHVDKTFKTEYLEFLKRFDVDYDERFLWD